MQNDSNTKRISMFKRAIGAMIGLACGDAVGAPVEFQPRGTFLPLTDMIAGTRPRPGIWTDDTAMALCLAESFILTKQFDPLDQMNRYVRLWKDGHLTAIGSEPGIGMTTRGALNRFLETGNPYSGPTDPYTAGNGSLMRLAPLVFFTWPDVLLSLNMAADSSRTTHGAPEAIECCQLLASVLCRILDGAKKDDILSDILFRPKEQAVADLASGQFLNKTYADIEATGHCVATLEAALWCFIKTDNFRDAVLKAVNLGDDADTVGAVVGQIAGAYYGEDAIPETWRQQLVRGEEIRRMATALTLANPRQPETAHMR